MVPSLLNTFNNKPFAMLLPAWAFDNIANAIIASMMTYYVRYIIKPEYSNGAWRELGEDVQALTTLMLCRLHSQHQ